MTLRGIGGVLFLIGLAGGTLLDVATPAAEPQRRGGYLVLNADFHVHGFPGDGWLAPYGLIHEARRRGLHAFALTNHNQVLTARIARRLARLVGGPTVLVGQEITSPDFHIIAVGIERTVDWRQSATEAIADVHSQGGVAIAAHPVARFLPTLLRVQAELDGTERMHPLVYSRKDEAEDLREFYRLGNSGGRRLTAIGSSDYHVFNTLGVARTLVFARSNQPAAILDAILEGRTAVRDEAGELHGDAAMIRLLEEDPLDEADVDYGYRGSGPVDRITRSCGWLGLLGLLAFRPRRSSGL